MNTNDLERYRAAEARLWNQYGVTPIEHRVHLPDFGINVRVLEVGKGEPVLFVHGSPNAGSKWAPLAAKLTDFRCLILDRPGCCLSDPVDYAPVNLRTWGAELLRQVLDGLQVPRAHVVASSLGGALAFYFTHAYPHRVTRLVQEGCPAFVEGFRVPFYNLASSVLGVLFGYAPPSREAFRHIGHARSIDNGRIEADVLLWRDALLRYTDTVRNENALNRNLSRRMRAYRYGPAFLADIKPATLYLWGEDDPFGDMEVAQRCAAAQPSALLQLFPASGHLPWLDDAAGHAGAIRAFLGSMPLNEPPRHEGTKI